MKKRLFRPEVYEYFTIDGTTVCILVIANGVFFTLNMAVLVKLITMINQGAKLMTHFKECVADLTMPKGWEDVSYGNDTCPSWLYKGFQVMIDHPDFKQRETNNEDENATRFYIFRAQEYGDAPTWNAECHTFKEVLSILNWHDVDDAPEPVVEESEPTLRDALEDITGQMQSGKIGDRQVLEIISNIVDNYKKEQS